MEHEIKILENYLDKNDNKLVSIKRFEFLEAIEHLIKAYKDLEEKNKKNLIEIICYQEELENSIPVSLVEETIEELIKEGRHYNANKIEVLQELLEKRN